MHPSRLRALTTSSLALLAAVAVAAPSVAETSRMDGRDALAEAAAQAAAAQAKSPDTRIVQCDGTDSDEVPRGLVLDCTGKTAALFDATWTSWGGPVAVGKGTFLHITNVNADKPDMYWVALKAHTLSKRGTQALYTKVEVTFTGVKPANLAKVVTYTFPVTRPRG